jgi:hypothetical protein
MSCMCGDTQCPSCGPAQGYDPQFERFCDAYCETVDSFCIAFAAKIPGVNSDELCENILTRAYAMYCAKMEDDIRREEMMLAEQMMEEDRRMEAYYAEQNAEMEIDSYQSPEELQQAKDWYDGRLK